MGISLRNKDVPEVWFAGDCHGDFSHIVRAAKNLSPQAIVFLGDLDCQRPLAIELHELPKGIQIAYIPGNHDSDTELSWDNLTESGFLNLHGSVHVVAGLKIAGLGGVFRKPWNPRVREMIDPAETGEAYARTLGKGNLFRGGLPLRHRTTIFPSDVAQLTVQHADVLVSHEAPGLHQFGFNVLTELARALNVSHAFHGHLHEHIVYPASPWAGVGYRSVVNLAGKVLIPPSIE